MQIHMGIVADMERLDPIPCESFENKLQDDELTLDHIDSITSMETRDPAEAQESVQELDVDTAITPERKEDLKSNLAGNLVEHSEPISFATIVESVSPTELVNKLSDELPKTVIQKMLSENSNINIAPAQVLKPSKEDEMHVKEMKMMEAALQGAAQEAQDQICTIQPLGLGIECVENLYYIKHGAVLQLMWIPWRLLMYVRVAAIILLLRVVAAALAAFFY
ncbi:unnamed protein product [Amaranthus hypochondriacus]